MLLIYTTKMFIQAIQHLIWLNRNLKFVAYIDEYWIKDKVLNISYWSNLIEQSFCTWTKLKIYIKDAYLITAKKKVGVCRSQIVGVVLKENQLNSLALQKFSEWSFCSCYRKKKQEKRLCGFYVKKTELISKDFIMPKI